VTVATIGILWCTYFDRGGKENLKLRVEEAYRPPSLFARVMQKQNHTIKLFCCDEQLEVTDLNGTTARLHDDVEILYVTTHGLFGQYGHEILLNANNWLVNGLGQNNLSVAIFDTCSLIEQNQAWKTAWTKAKPGNKLRLLLGFDGPAGIDRGLALRGKAFAENLTGGDTFADAWIKAVGATSVRPFWSRINMKAVAIGIGDSANEATKALNTMTLANMLGARSGQAIEFVERY
jgi:hypothetical protein